MRLSPDEVASPSPLLRGRCWKLLYLSRPRGLVYYHFKINEKNRPVERYEHLKRTALEICSQPPTIFQICEIAPFFMRRPLNCNGSNSPPSNFGIHTNR